MYYTVLTVDHVQKHYESQLKVTVEFTMSKAWHIHLILLANPFALLVAHSSCDTV